MNRFGFTLLEVLLSIALIGLIAGTAIPLYVSFQNRNDLDIAATTFAQSIRRAQVLSQAVDGDMNWGVSVHTAEIVIFKGTSYATRDVSADEVYDISSSVTVSGTQEYVFATLTGLPQNNGTITFTSVNNESRNVTINAQGTVSY